MKFEKTTFDLNELTDGSWRINREEDYVCFAATRSGLAKIIAALAPYHHGKKTEPILDDSSNSFVGNPHVICKIREMLQELRFEQL